MVIEYNTYGSELINNLITLYPASNDFDEEVIVRYHHRITSKTKSLGLRINKENKILYCEKMKKSVGCGQLIIKDRRTVDEAKTFSRNPNGSYSAQSGNDDCIMSCVTASSFFDTLDYTEIVEELFDNIDEDIQSIIDKMIENADSGNPSDYTNYDYIF
jgi:hypothetical protein